MGNSILSSRQKFLSQTDDALKTSLERDLIDPTKYRQRAKLQRAKIKVSNTLSQLYIKNVNLKDTEGCEHKKTCLFKRKKSKEEETGWIAEKTKIGQYIWRANVTVNKQDVETLLLFIFYRRDLDDQCPSVLINAGSHGNGRGQNAYQANDYRGTQPRIYEQVVEKVGKLLVNAQLKINQNNSKDKIHINRISSHKPPIYNPRADHVIDVQCCGALSKLSKQFFRDRNEDDLMFLSNIPHQRFSLTVSTNDSILSPPSGPFHPNPNNKQFTTKKNLFSSSKMYFENHQKQFVLKFFGNQVIKSAQLLYRASQQNFSIERFHKKCDGFNNTLTLCLTQFNKKIGGFTPLKWSSPNVGFYQKDISANSFIFSITNNDKFELKNTEEAKEKAIYVSKSLGPVFGEGCDLRISKDADESQDSEARICTSYTNLLYDKKREKQPWKKFHGGPNRSTFKIREWQIWNLKFQ